MKILCLLLGLCCLPQTPLSAQNNKAQTVFEENLAFLAACIGNDAIDTCYRVPGLIFFFEKLSAIESEADGTFFGKLSPTARDIENWRQWYNVNKNRLIWDPAASAVRLGGR